MPGREAGSYIQMQAFHDKRLPSQESNRVLIPEICAQRGMYIVYVQETYTESTKSIYICMCVDR